MERIFRRAQLPLATSQGFHPKPKVSYLSALPLGFSSQDEVMELVLEEDWDPEILRSRLTESTVQGLDFLTVLPLEDKAPKSKASAFQYQATIPADKTSEISEAIANFLSSASVKVLKVNGKEVEARTHVTQLELQGTTLTFTVAAQEGPEAGAREILSALGLGEELFRTIFPVRTKTYVQDA